MYKNCPYFENSGPNWGEVGSFVDKHHTSPVIDLIFGRNGKRLCNGDFSFLPMPLVLSVNDQSELQKAYWLVVSVWIE